jgi:hypothetical protein
MNQEIWRKVEELFHAALEHAPDGRLAFLDAACGKDTDLRRSDYCYRKKNELEVFWRSLPSGTRPSR